MSKIAGLYHNYIKERTAEFQEFCTGGDKMEELQSFLKQKLNAEDYFTAEEMLTALIAEIEEKGFSAGCKYISGLNHELLSE